MRLTLVSPPATGHTASREQAAVSSSKLPRSSLRNCVFDHTTEAMALVRFLTRCAICMLILALKMPDATNCSNKHTHEHSAQLLPAMMRTGR